MTQTGAEYDHNAEITALLHRHNLETAYGHNLVGNTFASRFLSCLRINRRVATTTARLDTEPVVSGYSGGLLSRLFLRPCPAATKGRP